ncbi:hypothetical protein MGG_00210 [Pyricularia oryzae 70-15]|uniref:Cerato-platanin n=3 Tax=Pyricularia oryzae TaxID=318829 RepID=G4NDT4_PYRO7|nr:uncharacterized protein MGG_00210 [Pyricularia oryzae 70-15]EHA49316.1 hypothetical protein MGG_00210 [Pyricularia oryzae 70-15]ELQ34123.1 hypothetical protein OOU_Y34scaffold00793g5 [Pyricularia oryzae Y34]KAI7918328.1 hypothetical protein M9X92_006958 [Pyricularia oryzae]KAI7918852.1 hypothetical protein M0657_007403 [Pyricularia oryzae]
MRRPALLSPRSLITTICTTTAAFFSTTATALTEGTVWATPHSQYSSSVGVLGCKVNTNRIAYWPGVVDCDKICISLSYESRSVNLLRVDTSEGAYDVSYDAWNYLITGEGARQKPTAGGAVAMEYREAPADACKSLIHTPGNKLPLSASNSMNFLASCLEQPNSWVAKNYVLYNVLDPICSWGNDETCTLNWPTENQAKCKSGLGTPSVLSNQPVYNIEYPTGKTVLASNGSVVESPPDDNAATINQSPGRSAIVFALFATASTWLFPTILDLL